MYHCCKPDNYIPYQPGFEQKIHYRNFVVPNGYPLYGIVSDFYQFDSTSSIGEVCVIPDGCIDLLFRYDRNGVTMTLEGYHRKKVVIPINQVGSAFGVRFVPGGLMNVIKVQTSDLIGSQIPLTDVVKKDLLLDLMENAQDFGERIDFISRYLLNRIHKSYGSVDIVRYCTEKIITHQGNVLIRDLSKETGYTTRYLRNLYHQHVGISPKELCEIIQFQASFMRLAILLKGNRNVSLCDIALQAGYYDQSHMNKCYQKMVGCLPQKFYSEVNQ
ncbi:helix-turn-helix domain-containing protein [Sinanaerobacter chloroacetimidivorans]|uniref:Helix-turn-helix domain-containing protein n=1 Tax=Sinanaerobacter chloroacetimidivorans TaxID=2818044 RepID=A0A8J7W1W3_9FIRM|nr:helix-turn-helix domain-containing protein [Sinanaerobacter chloroacetimidivorans]MBR0599367.1 helix-turn-helix domain-containing protein [Sinanaerobacter chloroacetimidivorans]